MDTAPLDFEAARRRMVERQLAARGIRAPLVLAAMGKVPREKFVSAGQAAFAYEDEPLPIGEGQTISQPYIVALMTEALTLGRKVERLLPLAERARRHLAALGYANVHVLTGDGTLGWGDHAPYDAIVATAGGPDVPTALLNQLAIGGRLVMPVGSVSYDQCLIRIVRAAADDYRREELEAVAFVPLIGAQGWPSIGAAR